MSEFINTTISLTYVQVFLIIFATLLFREGIKLFYYSMEFEARNKGISKLEYLVRAFLKGGTIVFSALIVLKLITYFN